MTIIEMKALQQFYVDEISKHASLRAPTNFQLELQDILFAQHKRVTNWLSKIL
ncbi:hypothetical protein QVN60_19170 [Yersinia aleksiciae]|uniref:hypothetical protein n=1 Tax=Yersinia aleksiciae TaxID=263819 RepID=UPI0025AA53AC|nr:hypothetical protein [Yersinia aleksiciae]MDN0125270.1 hypothetical protein [Yersinia aleksiciae]